MGTKFFDGDYLKKWHKENETPTAKSRRIVEQISRMFDLRRGSREESPAASNSKEDVGSNLKDAESVPSANKSGTVIGTGPEDISPPGTVLYELCSVILSKLVEAHSEYEKRFGSVKSEELSLDELLKAGPKGFEALTERLGKQLFKRHLIKAGCSRLHHEITYRLVLSSIDESFPASSSGEKPSTKSTVTTDNEPPSHNATAEVTEDMDIDPETSSAQETARMETEKEEIVEGAALPSPSSNANPESTNFSNIDSAPDRLTPFQPHNQRLFIKTVQKEVALLRESLPEGIRVKGFDDRMVIRKCVL
jgi:hypothetical protein